MQIVVSNEIDTVCPQFVGGAVEATVVNSHYSELLWQEIKQKEEEFKRLYTTETIKLIESVDATRKVYRLCGKDPSRYRPSSEALLRRVITGKSLYQIDTVVDIVNLASMVSGYSIGAFDKSKFVGDTLTLGIGRAGEPYEGIGRGTVNIEHLPVYRDAVGGVGTPTSDNERTKVDLSISHLLVIVNGYDGNLSAVNECCEYLIKLLSRYANCTDAKSYNFK
jgi:DNA/RNA-binding domain of Phe-tRNA-synthetase-like protein